MLRNLMLWNKTSIKGFVVEFPVSYEFGKLLEGVNFRTTDIVQH